MRKFMVKNKKGWVKIVESFLAILLVAGIAIVALNNAGVNEREFFSEAHDAQISVLREIQLNNSMRNDILGTNGTIEFNDTGFPSNIKNKISTETPDSLECSAKICNPEDLCPLNKEIGSDVFSESVIISSNLEKYNPRLLKLFCWES